MEILDQCSGFLFLHLNVIDYDGGKERMSTLYKGIPRKMLPAPNNLGITKALLKILARNYGFALFHLCEMISASAAIL